MFDTTILVPFVGILSTLTTLAVFDFYAFSPRPSGIVKRSRELAPILTIAIAIGLALVSLYLHSEFAINGLTLNGANDAMLTLQAERIRLFSYPLVITNSFESLCLGLALVISAYFMVTRIGLLGWSVTILAITLLNGVVAVAANPSGVNYGPFELILGLTIASTYAFSRRAHSIGQEKLELVALTAMIFASAAAGAMTSSPVRPELLVGALLIGTSMTASLFYLSKIAGPHWEATSLFFIGGLATFVVAGFVLAIAPHILNREQWNEEVATSRVALQADLIKTMQPLQAGTEVAPENEAQIARQLDAGATRLRYLISTAELSSNLNESDLRTILDLKSLERMLVILGRLHQSRALIADSERRLSATTAFLADPSRVDPMADFWQQSRPWMLSELRKLKREIPTAQGAFISSMETDIDRLTRAAIELEIHRGDAWVDWAARQPRELVPALKQVAITQIERLDTLATITEPLPLRKDLRFCSLHQNLRKMASVSEAKWE